MEQKISVLILTQNSGRTLERTLKSVINFDEVVLIDGGSTDNTKEIALKYNVKFVSNNFEGFSQQRNFSLTQASFPWCFVVDSDEVVTEGLRNKLYQIIAGDNLYPLYRIYRSEYLYGQEIKHGPSSNSIQERFFQRDLIKFEGMVHEYPLINGVKPNHDSKMVSNISSEFKLLHNPDVTIRTHIDKLPYYTALKADSRLSAGAKSSLLSIWFIFNQVFLKTLWKNRKNGRIGHMLAIVEACHKCLTHLLVYENEILKNEK